MKLLSGGVYSLVESTPLEQLRSLADTLPEGMASLCAVVLNDPYFAECPGGRTHHHAFKGGLAQHTNEVATLTAGMATDEKERQQAIVAAIFHDYAKTYEYIFDENGDIQYTPYSKQLGHVVGSWEAFRAAAYRLGDFGTAWIEAIGHAILAHHGRREWGSPVEPASRLAFILHSADMLSSRGITS